MLLNHHSIPSTMQQTLGLVGIENWVKGLLRSINLSITKVKSAVYQIPPCESSLTLLLEDRQQSVDALPQVDHHAYTSALADTKLKHCGGAKAKSDESPFCQWCVKSVCFYKLKDPDAARNASDR